MLYPLWVSVSGTAWSFSPDLWLDLFPVLGITAFCIMWLHVVGGALEEWLERYVNFQRFVDNTSIFIFVLIILHPLFLLIGQGFRVADIFLYGQNYIMLGVAGLLMLLTYDLGKARKEREFFVRHWNAVLIVSTIGFLLIFFHSLGLGSDVQAGPLRDLWIFYGTTAIVATTYNYGVKKLLR